MGMAAVILGWNPERWSWDGTYARAVSETHEVGRHLGRWPNDCTEVQPIGTEAWLFVQGGGPNQRGLIGHGVTVSKPFRAHSHTFDTGTGSYIQVEFDLLLPEGDQLRTAELAARVPAVEWESLNASVQRLPTGSEAEVRAAWTEHVIGDHDGDTLEPPPGTCPEDALTRVAVNRYERNADARRVALAHHGSRCAACGFDFEQTYGAPGSSCVHVHHTVPVSQLGRGYELDPTADLIPLCPNCHHMAHRRKPDAYTVAELRAMISAGGHLRGAIMSEEQMAAEAAAKTLLQN